MPNAFKPCDGIRISAGLRRLPHLPPCPVCPRIGVSAPWYNETKHHTLLPPSLPIFPTLLRYGQMLLQLLAAPDNPGVLPAGVSKEVVLGIIKPSDILERLGLLHLIRKKVRCYPPSHTSRSKALGSS